MNETPRLWSVSTVARRLGVSRSMVFHQIHLRRLAAIRIGRFWRVEPDAVAAFLDAHRQAAELPELGPVVDDRQLALFSPTGEDRLALAADEELVEDEERLA